MNHPFRRPGVDHATRALPDASAPPQHPVTIAAARHQPLGSTVTVRGTVTVPSGTFDGGFAIQQDEAGIYVLDSGGTSRAVADSVLVTGTLVDNYGLLSIQPTSPASTLGHGAPIEPQRRPTGAVGEATESRLIAIHGTQVGDVFVDGTYGWKIQINDGSGPVQVFIYPSIGFDVSVLHAGVSLSVNGFSNQYETTYECDPPTAGDLKVH